MNTNFISENIKLAFINTNVLFVNFTSFLGILFRNTAQYTTDYRYKCVPGKIRVGRWTGQYLIAGFTTLSKHIGSNLIPFTITQ